MNIDNTIARTVWLSAARPYTNVALEGHEGVSVVFSGLHGVWRVYRQDALTSITSEYNDTHNTLLRLIAPTGNE